MSDDMLKRIFEDPIEQELSVDEVLRQLSFQGKMELLEARQLVNMLVPGDKALSGKVMRLVFLDTADIDFQGVSARFAFLYNPFESMFYCKKVLPSRIMLYEAIPKGSLLVYRFNSDGIPTHFVIKDNGGFIIEIDHNLREELMLKFKKALLGVYVDAELVGGENIWKPFISYFRLDGEAEETIKLMNKLKKG